MWQWGRKWVARDLCRLVVQVQQVVCALWRWGASWEAPEGHWQWYLGAASSEAGSGNKHCQSYFEVLHCTRKHALLPVILGTWCTCRMVPEVFLGSELGPHHPFSFSSHICLLFLISWKLSCWSISQISSNRKQAFYRNLRALLHADIPFWFSWWWIYGDREWSFLPFHLLSIAISFHSIPFLLPV